MRASEIACFISSRAQSAIFTQGEGCAASANGSSLERLRSRGDDLAYTMNETAYGETAAYGGLADAIGGVATIVLAVIGLAGVHGALLAAIATIVFGVALMIQGGTMLSEFAAIYFPQGLRSDASDVSVDRFGGASLSILLLVGAAGVVLRVLALLGIQSAILAPAASIAFGTALVLASDSVWRLYLLGRASTRSGLGTTQTQTAQMAGREILASDMAAGSAGVQSLAGDEAAKVANALNGRSWGDYFRVCRAGLGSVINWGSDPRIGPWIPKICFA